MQALFARCVVDRTGINVQNMIAKSVNMVEQKISAKIAAGPEYARTVELRVAASNVVENLYVNIARFAVNV